ncbi:GIY-YIG nuclease family protein [Cohnella sp. REN36]|uniref:GIY-YIG nuclease family protein n=1 Tax=Cohnella sp. REN36 TaxID=2887347 RepID=UPI001D156E54|nr:GIY-YIG nuclease family protein [Cohnella sp. REN36]
MTDFVFRASAYPDRPGCYLMKDAQGRVLYIGKSKNIRSRLRAYFNGTDKRRRIADLVPQIAEIGYIVVTNERESLLLENNLIKIHKPPYNRALKRDNSGYAYLRLTDEPLPRLDAYYRDRRPVREVLADRAGDEVAAASEAGSRETSSGERFGPFVSGRFREALIAFVTEHYRLRTCVTLPKRACLLYHLGKCSGVCAGYISEEDYRESARQAAELLEHTGERLIAAMYAQMEAYAEQLQFEKAAHMLHHIRILERQPERQIVDRETEGSQEAVYFGEDRVVIAGVHEGMLHRLETLPWERSGEGSACDRFLVRHYAMAQRPNEIIASEIGDARGVRTALRRRGEPPVRLTVPRRGLKYELLQLCRANLETQIELENAGRSPE